MKNIAFLFFLIILPYSVNSQTPTKEETQDWIRGILESYPARLELVSRTCKISFSQSKLVVTVRNVSQYSDDEFITTIPIEKIISVKFNAFNENIYNMVIITKGGSDISFFHKGSQSLELFGKAEISLSKKIDEEDLQPRLIKAFKYLVKAYGGEIKDDPF